MSRKTISKAMREKVYNKYNGHCAYCGCDISIKEMQVDHINAHYLGGTDEIDNYMPACRPCNFYKSTFGIDVFRERLQTTLLDNLKNTFNYKMLVKYGLIKEDVKPIVFYFEKFN